LQTTRERGAASHACARWCCAAKVAERASLVWLTVIIIMSFLQQMKICLTKMLGALVKTDTRLLFSTGDECLHLFVVSSCGAAKVCHSGDGRRIAQGVRHGAASASYNKLSAKHEQAYWGPNSSANCRAIYASSISLIDVLDILVTPDVTCHGAYRISRCVKQPEPIFPGDLV